MHKLLRNFSNMTLKELQNAGDYLVFVDESIIRPAVIELEAGNFEINDACDIDAWQLAFRVTIVRREQRERLITTQGPIETHVVYLDDIRILRFIGPYFSLRSASAIDNAKMLAWCRERVWNIAVTVQLGTADARGIPPVIKL